MDDGALAAVARQFAGGDQGGDGGGGDRFAALVDDEAAVGVAVEGQAEVGALLAHPLPQVDEVGRVEGLASWLGKVPSSSKYIGTRVSGSPANTVGTVCPPMPLPASTTTFRGRMPVRSTSERRWAA